MIQQRSRLLEDAAFRGIIWAFTGMIFSFLFVLLGEYIRDIVPNLLRIWIATIGASVLTALLYSSMRLTVVIANFVFIALMMYVLKKPDGATLEPLILIGSGLGALLGALYGWQDKQSHICRADGKIVAGFIAGILAAIPVLLLYFVIGEIDYPWSAMMITPLAIFIYVSSAYWFVNLCHTLLSPIFDGLLVGCGMGGITALIFVSMAGSFSPEALGLEYHQEFVQRIYHMLGPIVSGSAAVCFLVGVLRSIFHVRWYDL